MLEARFASFAALAGSSTLTLVLLLKATIILVAALEITLMMQQRFSAGARHVVWLVTVAALLLVPALTLWAPIPVRILPAVSTFAAPSAIESASPVAVSGDQLSINEATPLAADARVRQDDVQTPVTAPQQATIFGGMSLVTVLLLLWAGVVLAIAGSLAFAALSVRRI